jgi:Kef-type K+ transport system membrane component KefB/nucleotide-binding universal stress UspA family protein
MLQSLILAAGDAPTNTVIKSLSHHAVLLLLVQLAVLLFVARLLGEVMRKLKQPAVIGELTAGIVLGPSLLGAVAPDIQAAIFPMEQHQADLLSVVAWLGVICLLVVTGLETDIGLIRRRGASALLVSAGGIIVPFATGFALGQALPAEYLTTPDDRIVFSLFMAVAMSISAVPVIAKVLMDLRLIRRDIGQLILAAAMTDDTIGWVLLAVVAGLATAGTVDVTAIVWSIGGALAVILVAFTIGGKIVGAIIAGVDRWFGGDTAQLSTILVLALAAAAGTHHLGIEAVLGAFIVGILVAQAHRFRQEVAHTLETVTAAFLAPIFFASAGLKVNLLKLGDSDVFAIGLVVLGVACIGKFLGTYLGGYLARVSHWERLALGSGMNARGAMEIIVATVGLGLGVLTVEMYSIIVMVAVATSLMAPPLLRWTLSKVTLSANEVQRLEREEIALTSLVRSFRRVLVMGRSVGALEMPSQLVAYLSHEQPTESVAAYVRSTRVRPGFTFNPTRRDRLRRAQALLRVVQDRLRRGLDSAKGLRPEVKVLSERSVGELALLEVGRGYDLIILSDPRRGSSNHGVFSPFVDLILQRTRTVVLAFKTPSTRGAPWLYRPWTPKRILVPTTGTQESTNAVELAAVLSASTGAEILIAHVLREGGTDRALVDEMLQRQSDYARKFGGVVRQSIVAGASPEEALLALAHEESCDLILLGASRRIVRARAYFGRRVERILQEADVPVGVVSVP